MHFPFRFTFKIICRYNVPILAKIKKSNVMGCRIKIKIYIYKYIFKTNS